MAHLIDRLCKFVKMMAMKRILYLMLVACFAAGCGEVTPETHEEAWPIVLTKSQTAVMEQGNEFAFKLLREADAQFAGSNLFLSPMGVTIVSSMLANGAKGTTYDEIVEAIGLKGYTLDQVNDCYKTLVSALYGAAGSVSFTLANSIWAANDLSLRKQFCKNMEDTFDAESFSVDFGASGTLKQVNGWCSKKTNGLIPKMFEQLSPLTRVLLINALYFKGDWQYSFDESATAEGSFQTLSGTQAKVQYMMLAGDLEVYRDDKVSLVKMPYSGNGAFLMEAIVPTGDFKAFLSGLSLAQLQQWDQAARVQEIKLRFPKFTAEFDTDEQLVPVLMRLGIRQAFSANAADFSNMSPEPLYVSNFRQKTYIKVDEKGTEAAAITEAEMRKNSAQDHSLFISFDRPFIYLIRESSTGAILFLGTKVN